MFVQWGITRLFGALFGRRKGPAPGDPALIGALGAHIEGFFHAGSMVYHEIISSIIHIDIYVVPPAPDRPYYALITCGMSERPMQIPSEAVHAARHVELVMLLPPDWRLEKRDFVDERWYWPVRHLKILARAPHEWDTWFGPGHTMQLDADLKPFAANTQLCAYMLAPEPFGDGFSPLRLDDGREISFLMAVPIFAEELAHARDNGAEALVKLFDENEIDTVVDPLRHNVCKPGPA